MQRDKVPLVADRDQRQLGQLELSQSKYQQLEKQTRIDDLFVSSHLMYVKALLKQRAGEFSESNTISIKVYKTILQMISTKDLVLPKYWVLLFRLLLLILENYHQKKMFNDASRYCRIVVNLFEEKSATLANEDSAVVSYKKAKAYLESDPKTFKTDLQRFFETHTPAIDRTDPFSNKGFRGLQPPLEGDGSKKSINRAALSSELSFGKPVTRRAIQISPRHREDSPKLVKPKLEEKNASTLTKKTAHNSLSHSANTGSEEIWNKIMALKFNRNPYVQANKTIKKQLQPPDSTKLNGFRKFISEKRFSPYKINHFNADKKGAEAHKLDELVEWRKRSHSKGFTSAGFILSIKERETQSNKKPLK